MRVIMAVLACCGGVSAYADSPYPDHPVTIIVPYPAGGSTDVVARVVAQKLTERLKQSFVIENKGGANGIIGMEAAARAKPDGYTLMINTAGAQTLTPVLYKTSVTPYEGWEPIGQISTIPLIVVAREGLPVKTFADMVALAKTGSPPLKASAGSPMITLITDSMKNQIGASTMIIAQYRGTAPQAQAVLTGEVDISVDSFVTKPYILTGKVRPLAVIAAQRMALFPDVPTIAEVGFKDLLFESWSGMLAPKGTPKAIVDRLATELQQIIHDPQVIARLKDYDNVAVSDTSPETFGKILRSDYANWQRIVKETGYKVE